MGWSKSILIRKTGILELSSVCSSAQTALAESNSAEALLQLIRTILIRFKLIQRFNIPRELPYKLSIILKFWHFSPICDQLGREATRSKFIQLQSETEHNPIAGLPILK